jgi:hypothetical protein
MEKQLRRRLRIEAILASVSAALFVLTLVFPEWIEATTGLEPDSGSGALELVVAGAFLVAAVVSGVLAHRNQRRLAAHRA